MIGTIDIEIQAHNPQFPLHAINAIESSPSSIRLRGVPKVIGNWKITSIHFTATYPDNTTKIVDCKLIGGVWVGTFEGCSTTGTVKNGFIVYADGIDENENVVTGYVLGMGDIFIISKDGRIIPQQPIKVLNLLESRPSTAHYGDCYFDNGTFYIYDGEWKTTLDVSIFATKKDLPTKISQLENDVGYSKVIESTDVEGYAENSVYANTAQYAEMAQQAEYASSAGSAYSVDWNYVDGKPDIPSKTSDLENDSGYYNGSEVQATVESAIEIVEQKIPTKTSDLENDSGFSKVIESTEQAYKGYAENSRYAIESGVSTEANWADEAGKVDWENVDNKPDVAIIDNTVSNEKKIIIDSSDLGNSGIELNSANGSYIDFITDEWLFRINDDGFESKWVDGSKREIFATCSEFDVYGDLKERGKRMATKEYVDSQIGEVLGDEY